MLNISEKNTYTDPNRFSWEYYGDDTDSNTYYVVPRPQFVMDGSDPSFQIVKFQTDDPKTSGSGYCRFDVMLAVPADVQAAIAAQIGGTPNVEALAENRGGMAAFTYTSSGQPVTVSAPVSAFGSDVASFVLELTANQLTAFETAFTTSGGAGEIKFYLTVPARLPAVKAVLSFDSSIAFQYQVTQPSFNEWGDETDPGSVQKLLQASSSSKVVITWGIANPPAQLEQDVADWANTTLASQVQAQVQQEMQLQGLSSGDSFNINEVSSFTSEYDTNEVVDWVVEPTEALPSFTDMGLEITNFEGTADQRQQVMTVTTQLEFQGNPQDAKATNQQVTSVEVTAVYPGLSQADGSHTFEANGNVTFATPYSPDQGPAWDLEYTANYTGNAPSVAGRVQGITQGNYTLTLPDVGALAVTFDATDAFAATNPPDSVLVNISFPNQDGHGTPYSEPITLDSKTQTGSVSSFSAVPLTSGYSYQAVYKFGSTVVSGPLNTNVNGSKQTIPAAAGLHETGLIVYVPADAGNPVLEVDVDMFYAGQPQTIPGGPDTYPSKESPAQFKLIPGDKNFALDSFEGLINGNQPLVYSATITSGSGQVGIDAQLIANGYSSILVNPTQRYYTLEVNVDAIDWDSVTFKTVEVLIKPAGGLPTTAEQTLTWNENESGSQYLTWAVQEAKLKHVQYMWQATYYIPNENAQQTTMSAATADILLPVPANPPADAIALDLSTVVSTLVLSGSDGG